MKTNKKTTKKTNAKNAKAAKKAVKCCLCGKDVKGHGHNPHPLADKGVCCDECNANVLAERVKLAAKSDKLAKRREYARAYYKANREKLVAASSRSHAKRAAEAKALLNEAFDMLQGIASERGYEGLVRYGDPSVITRLADYLGKEA